MVKAEFKLAVGRRLKDIRNRKLFCQDELAARTGLHRTQISHIECGLRLPTLDKVRRLATALNVSVDELVPAL